MTFLIITYNKIYISFFLRLYIFPVDIFHSNYISDYLLYIPLYYNLYLQQPRLTSTDPAKHLVSAEDLLHKHALMESQISSIGSQVYLCMALIPSLLHHQDERYEG